MASTLQVDRNSWKPGNSGGNIIEPPSWSHTFRDLSWDRPRPILTEMIQVEPDWLLLSPLYPQYGCINLQLYPSTILIAGHTTYKDILMKSHEKSISETTICWWFFQGSPRFLAETIHGILQFSNPKDLLEFAQKPQAAVEEHGGVLLLRRILAVFSGCRQKGMAWFWDLAIEKKTSKIDKGVGISMFLFFGQSNDVFKRKRSITQGV